MVDPVDDPVVEDIDPEPIATPEPRLLEEDEEEPRSDEVVDDTALPITASEEPPMRFDAADTAIEDDDGEA